MLKKINVFPNIVLLCVLMCTPLAHAQSSTIEIIRMWAEKAQQECFMKIHFDTFAYQDCLVLMAKNHLGDKPIELGIYYFGYVGAMDSVRTGMYGSKNTAWFFLNKFKRIQRSLLLDDRALCATVPGNCDIRIAQMMAMNKDLAPKPFDSNSAVLRDLHDH